METVVINIHFLLIHHVSIVSLSIQKNTSSLKLVPNTPEDIEFDRWSLIKTKTKKNVAVFLELKYKGQNKQKHFIKFYVKEHALKETSSGFPMIHKARQGTKPGSLFNTSCLYRNNTINTHSFSISMVTGHRSTLERKWVKIRDLLSVDGGEWRLVMTGSTDAH